jgi:hypothetical protein
MRVCMHAPRTQSAPQTPRPLCRSTENLSLRARLPAIHSHFCLETRCTCRLPFRHPHIPSPGQAAAPSTSAFEPTRLAPSRWSADDLRMIGLLQVMVLPCLPARCAVPIMARRRWWVHCRLSSHASCWHPSKRFIDDSRPEAAYVLQHERGYTVA